jgi:hypothetical protein
LTSAERALFIQTVDAHAHLKFGDTAMLTAYVRAMVRHEQLSQTDNTVAWNRSGQLALAMARGLRLLPSTAARTLVRAREDLRASPIAQYLAENPDDDDSENRIQ